MKRKILHVSSMPLSSGGVERFLLGLCKELGDEFEFGLLSGANRLFSDEMVRLGNTNFQWKVNGLLDRIASKKFDETINKFQPDIIHFHDARARLLSFFDVHQMAVKRVYTAHLPPYYYRWEKYQKTRRVVYGFVEGILNNWYTDLVVFPSRYGLDYSLRHHYATSRRAICIPNGIDLQPYYLTRSIHRNQDESVPIICTVARLSVEKNVTFLLDAAAILKTKGYPFKLWIIGDGPEQNDLNRRSDELGLNSFLRFWGRQEDIASLLKQSDIFVLASWYEGGRSQSVMEAQAAGLPCVVSDVGDNASMMDGQRGFSFVEGDLEKCVGLLEYLLNSPDQRHLIGKRAREHALAEYSLQKMTNQYRGLYLKLLGSTG